MKKIYIIWDSRLKKPFIRPIKKSYWDYDQKHFWNSSVGAKNSLIRVYAKINLRELIENNNFTSEEIIYKNTKVMEDDYLKHFKNQTRFEIWESKKIK